MPICYSRKNMHSVMSNSGFGEVVIQKDQYIIELPQTAINKTTQQVKKYVAKQLNNLDKLTIAEAMHLQNTYGIGVCMK